MKKIFLNFILISFFSLFIFAIDLTLTKLIFKDYHYFEINEKRAPKKQFYRIENKFYHHGFLPNIDIIEKNIGFGENRFVTNSLAFKDSKIRKINLKKTKHRILFIGDSFTEGVLLNYEDTFVGIIDKNLKKLDIEVLNAGVGSYHPTIYHNKISYLINDLKLEFDELFVFIDLSDLTDEINRYVIKNNLEKNSNTENKKNKKEIIVEFLKKNLILSYTILNYAHDKIHAKVLSDKNNFIKHMSATKGNPASWAYDEEVYKQYGEFGVNLMKAELFKLIELTRKNNIKITLAVYPWFQEIYNENIESKNVNIWSKFAKDNNIEIMNFYPYFFENTSNKLSIINKYYIPFDVHFNKNGNKLIADNFLIKFLNKTNDKN
jgi:hypothetical protein